MFGGTTAPTGWLLCDGQSTASYTALAAVVGANVPDLRGRAPIGYGDSADSGITTRSTIGAKVGAETHTLTIAEIPDHTHIGPLFFNPTAGTGTSGAVSNSGSPTTNRPSTDGVNGTTGGAHNNMQPSTVVNFIIKH